MGADGQSIAAGDRRLTDALLAWGDGHRRDLPWRRTRDPWKIHVAEVMLQQTQVDRVQPRWSDFVDRYRTVGACAAAPTADIIALWVGLGFNRRAVLLQRAARAVQENYGGTYPDDLPSLLALPGVGAYTARAIMCFAFERDVAVVDTNVGRVLARWRDRVLARGEAQSIADGFVPPGRSWEWNQTMLDLGATVCTRRSPRCDACPVASWCGWARQGRPDPDPAIGSAGTSTPQSRFEGSDRQGRGRLIAALVHGPVAMSEVPTLMGWPDDPERAKRVLQTMVDDDLVECGADSCRVPEWTLLDTTI